MNKLFEYNDFDREYYQAKLRDFLPSDFIDIHTHIWQHNKNDVKHDNRAVSWPDLVAAQNPIEDLAETYKIMFPDKNVKALVFGTLSEKNRIDAVNEYVRKAAASVKFPALIFTNPAWSSEELEQKMLSGRFLGGKGYLTMADPSIPSNDIRIYDFFPKKHLAVFDKYRSIVMLHIPRKLRLKDPENLKQMLEIEEEFPNLQLIIAHVGRAYCKCDLGNSMELLAKTKRMRFDFSANTNDYVFAKLIETVGAERILFGSDMPISRMRMRRIEKDGIYVNVIPKGLYGDVSNDPNMMEVDGEEAKKLSFFIYEEIYAFRRAAEACGLAKADIEKVFHLNAVNIIKTAEANLK